MKKKVLQEQAISRVEELTKVSRLSFGKIHDRMTQEIFEAMSYSNNELDTLAIAQGVLIQERAGDDAVNKAVDSLKSDSAFEDIPENDLKDLVQYFIDQNAGSIVFAPEVLAAFVTYAKEVGFPATFGAIEKGGLEAPRYNTATLLRVLVGSHVLTVTQVPGVDAKDAKHTSQEDESFRENPKVKVDIYEYDQSFLRELSHVLRLLGVKEESLDKRSFGQRLVEKREIEMQPSKRLEDLEKKIESILSEADKKDEEEPESSQEKDFFKVLTDDMVEKFVDGILIVLGELEQNGDIERIESPEAARDAVLASIRRLHQKRGLVSKLSRKYARFGAKRVLKKGKQDINKALQ